MKEGKECTEKRLLGLGQEGLFEPQYKQKKKMTKDHFCKLKTEPFITATEKRKKLSTLYSEKSR